MSVRRWHEWPLTAKLVTAFLLVAVLSTLVMAAVGTVFLRGQLLADLQQRNLHRATATAKALDAYLSDLNNRLKVVAALPQTAALISQSEPRPGRFEIENSLVRLSADSGFEAVIITDRSGKVVASSAPRLLGASFVGSPAFVWAMGGIAAIDDPAYDPVDRQVYLYFSAPVSVTGTVLGTVIGRVTLDAIDAIVMADGNFTGHGEFGVLWNEYGIRFSQPSDTGLRFRPLAPVPQSVADQLETAGRFGPGTREFIQSVSPWPGVLESSQALLHSRNAGPYLQVAAPNSDTLQVAIAVLEKKRWFYGVAAPETGINAAVAVQWRMALLIIIGAAVVAAIAAIFMARSINRSMAEVAMAPAAEKRPAEPPGRPYPSAKTDGLHAQAAPEESPPETPDSSQTSASEEAQTVPAAPQKPADEHPGTSRPAPPETPAEPGEQPTAKPEPAPAVSGSAVDLPSPPENLLSAPQQSRAPVIAPVSPRVELAMPPESPLLQEPVIDTADHMPGPSEEPASPEPPPPAEMPQEKPPTVEEEPPETGRPSSSKRPGWGTPLARPPLGPLS